MPTTRKQLDDRILKMLSTAAHEAVKEYENYVNRCQSCRMVNDSYVRDTVGTFNPFDCGLRRDRQRVYCPECNRCVFDDDDRH